MIPVIIVRAAALHREALARGAACEEIYVAGTKSGKGEYIIRVYVEDRTLNDMITEIRSICLDRGLVDIDCGAYSKSGTLKAKGKSPCSTEQINSRRLPHPYRHRLCLDAALSH